MSMDMSEEDKKTLDSTQEMDFEVTRLNPDGSTTFKAERDTSFDNIKPLPKKESSNEPEPTVDGDEKPTMVMINGQEVDWNTLDVDQRAQYNKDRLNNKAGGSADTKVPFATATAHPDSDANKRANDTYGR